MKFLTITLCPYIFSMREVILPSENYFSWRTLKDALHQLPLEPHVLVIQRLSWVQMIIIEVVGGLVPFVGFILLNNLVDLVCKFNDEPNEQFTLVNLYILFAQIGFWIFIICLNYERRDVANECIHWSKIFALMTIWESFFSKFSFFPLQLMYWLSVMGMVFYRLIEALQDIFDSFPVQLVGIKICMTIFSKEKNIIDITSKFDDMVLFLLKRMNIGLLKIELDAKGQWQPGMFKDFKRIVDIAQSLPHGFFLNVENNRLFEHLNEEDRFNHMVHFRNSYLHLKFDNNGYSDAKNAFLVILSMIKQHELPAVICIEIYTYLFNFKEIQYLTQHYQSNDVFEPFSSFHVHLFMKEKIDELGKNSKSLSAISFP